MNNVFPIEENVANSIPLDSDFFKEGTHYGNWTAYRFYNKSEIPNVSLTINGEVKDLSVLADVDTGDWHYGRVTKVAISSTCYIELTRSNV